MYGKRWPTQFSSWSHSLSTLLKCVCLYWGRKRGPLGGHLATNLNKFSLGVGIFWYSFDWLIDLFPYFQWRKKDINSVYALRFDDELNQYFISWQDVYSYYVNGGAMDDARDVLCRCWNFFIPTPLKKNTFPVLFFPFFIGWLHLTETPQAVQCHLYM